MTRAQRWTSLPCPCAPTQRYNRCHAHVHLHSIKIAAMPMCTYTAIQSLSIPCASHTAIRSLSSQCVHMCVYGSDKIADVIFRSKWKICKSLRQCLLLHLYVLLWIRARGRLLHFSYQSFQHSKHQLTYFLPFHQLTQLMGNVKAL